MSDEEKNNDNKGQTHEAENKTFLCEVCLRKYSKSSARSRCRRQHKIANNEVEPHRCHICGAEFPRSDHFTKHMITHEKNKRCTPSSSKSEPLAKNPKNEYVTKEEMKVAFQKLRDLLASSNTSDSCKADVVKTKFHHQFVCTNEIFHCYRCRCVFQSADDIEKHDTICVQKNGLMNSNFRDGIIKHLVQNLSHELTVSVLTQSVVDSFESKNEIKKIVANSNSPGNQKNPPVDDGN